MDEDQVLARRLAARLLESSGKEGVYYVVPFPTRWRLYAFPWEDFGDLWHGDVWRRFVINDIAEAWAPSLGIAPEGLRRQLEPWSKGTPRGRVERAGVQEYTIFHADDLDETAVTKDRIQMAFELVGSKVVWSIDPHEKQNPEHRAALRRLLGLP
jgi:hypothetical protein